MLPKRGFTHPFKVIAQPVNLRELKKLAGTEVTAEALKEAGLVTKAGARIKLLGPGEADRAYTVRGMLLSDAAPAKPRAALLPPGPYNGTSFEPGSLACYLG